MLVRGKCATKVKIIHFGHYTARNLDDKSANALKMHIKTVSLVFRDLLATLG